MAVDPKSNVNEANGALGDGDQNPFTPQIPMEITVRPIEPQGNMCGFASIKIGGVKIDDFKILENKDGELFVGMPSKPDKTSNTGYRNTVFVDKDFKDDFNAVVIGKYHEAVEVAQSRVANFRTAPNQSNDKTAPNQPPNGRADGKTTPDKPESINAQMKKAQKEADKHNAALPTKEKGSKNHGDRE